jgi:AsmA protein
VPAAPNSTFLLAPTTLNLGGREPALLEGHFDASGYTLHLTGAAVPTRLLGLAAALPQFGNGLPALFPNPGTTPTHIDLTATGSWTAPHTWTRTASAAPGTPSHLHAARQP